MKDIKAVFLELNKIRVPDDRRGVILDNVIKSCMTSGPDRSGKRSFPRKTFILAASMVSAAILVTVLISVSDKPFIVKTTPETGAIETASPETTVQRKIVYAGSSNLSIDDAVPKAGVCLIGCELKQAIDDPENEDALFYVYLEAYIPSSTDDDFIYEGKTLAEWKTLKQEYIKGFNNFFEEKIKENSDYTAAEKEAWLMEWEETHGKDPSLKYSEAVKARSRDIKTAEIQRLSASGLSVELKENENYLYMTGFLTEEQIRDFPCGEAGYYLLLIEQTFNGCVTEGIDD